MDEVPEFDIGNWFWNISDTNRYWSSADGSYVLTAEIGKTTSVPDEAQLVAVLSHLGLPRP